MNRGNLVRAIWTAALVVVLAIVATAPAGADTCHWQLSVAPNVVRFPIQMDIHAGYRMFAFQSDGTVGYRVRGAFPFAAFMSFTTYNQADAMLYAALLDKQIQPDQGSINPFTPGDLVNAFNRSYTVTVLPDGTVPDASMPTPIFFPPPAPGSDSVTVVLVERVYLAEPQADDRFAEAIPPTIEAFEVDNPSTPAACPTGDFSAITSQFGSFGDNFSQSPLPQDGKIEFYRPPASLVPYADGSGPLTDNDCTGYLMATVYPHKLAVIHLAAVPTFFDNTNITPETIFADPQVRYLSFGSYGASPLSAAQNENVAGPDLKTLPDGSATFVAIPRRLSRSLKRRVEEKAAELGYNVLPLAKRGFLPYPFLIYRNKVAANGSDDDIPKFDGDIQNVPCYQGPDFSQAPSTYAASTANMGQYAPVGIECSPRAFLRGLCGQ
jgi:hypothetical protein